MNKIYTFLENEKKKDYFKQLILTLEKSKKKIFPKKDFWFLSLNQYIEKVKVVIVGQDPYPNNKATGFAFSTNNQLKSKSLNNIFYELKRSKKDFVIPNHGSLRRWVFQGILLLNSILTVEENCPLSHENIGWEIYTNKIIKILDTNCENLIFLFWGEIAKKKKNIIKNKKNLFFLSSHPSNNRFIGNNHFNLIDNYHLNNNIKKIKWNL